jgi:hypothetical protein
MIYCETCDVCDVYVMSVIYLCCQWYICDVCDVLMSDIYYFVCLDEMQKK